MAVLRVMLVLSAIAMSAVSFPSTRSVEEKELLTEGITDSILHHSLQPVAVLTENNDSKQKSSFVEFVRKGDTENSTAEPGTDNEKYAITNIATKKNISKHTENEEISDSEHFNTKIENSNFPSTSDGEDKSGLFTYEDTWSLSPRELSAITEGIPKYFFGMIQPSPPFPEISREPKLKDLSYSKAEKSEKMQPFIIPKKVHYHPYPAGPVLYPQSIYNREFSIPFFE